MKKEIFFKKKFLKSCFSTYQYQIMFFFFFLYFILEVRNFTLS